MMAAQRVASWDAVPTESSRAAFEGLAEMGTARASLAWSAAGAEAEDLPQACLGLLPAARPYARCRAAGLDEGLLPLTLSNLLYMENPYSHKRCRRRMTARPRISTQAYACGWAGDELLARTAVAGRLNIHALAGPGGARLGLYPIVTLVKQLLNLIGKLV